MLQNIYVIFTFKVQLKTKHGISTLHLATYQLGNDILNGRLNKLRWNFKQQNLSFVLLSIDGIEAYFTSYMTLIRIRNKSNFLNLPLAVMQVSLNLHNIMSASIVNVNNNKLEMILLFSECLLNLGISST